MLSNHETAVLAILEHKKLIEKGEMPANDKSNVALLPNLNLKNSEGDTPVSLALSEGIRKSYGNKKKKQLHKKNTKGRTFACIYVLYNLQLYKHNESTVTFEPLHLEISTRYVIS